ncbi:hypothetical protein [Hyalangium versicolor]|uniref:hypothetical protein n=1 Tax=Hyalangium versicolor TaxID=2861190 RepID=UPI001CC8F855|nr:hypothetical protein [Hyalangium versicolor]
MGDWYQIIVDRDVSETDAPSQAERMRKWLIERGFIEPHLTNSVLGKPGHAPGPAYGETLQDSSAADRNRGRAGLQFNVGHRIVFHALNGEVTCRSCQAHVDLDEHGSAWMEAVDAWYEGDNSVTFTCPACGRPEQLTAWDGPVPWGFGNLGLEFWNWTPLSERFVREVSEKLGHRTVLVRSKL